MKDGPVWLAIGLCLGALTSFSLMGLVVKYLSPSYGAAELAAWRNLFGLIPSAVALWFTRDWQAKGRPWRIRQWRLAVARGAIIVLAQVSFYMSLGLIAFATATTISYANALFMTALAVPILGERVGPMRWFAVLMGALGVLLVTGLGSDAFSWAALLPVLAAFNYALTGVTARCFDAEVPTPLVNMYSAGIAVLGAVSLALATTGISPIASLADLGWILAMGIFGGLGVLGLIVSFRMTEQSNLAPFTYFGIPIAFVLGWVFFGEAPVDDLFPGAILIAAGGLLIVWREHRRRRGRTGPESGPPPA